MYDNINRMLVLQKSTDRCVYSISSISAILSVSQAALLPVLFTSYIFFSAVNDFTDPGLRKLVFKPFEDTTCTEVPIIDDDNIEQPEDFGVTFSGAQTPGVTMGGVTRTLVIIIDDDADSE